MDHRTKYKTKNYKPLEENTAEHVWIQHLFLGRDTKARVTKQPN